MISEKRCIKCTLPYNFPGMSFNEAGLCEVCQKYDKKWTPWLENKELQQRTELKLQNKISQARAKGKIYDCIVGISGGKDSLYTLYLAVKKFGLRPLAVSLDNGFLVNEAKLVIRQACEELKVDYIIYRVEMIYGLYRHFFLQTGTFCTACVYMTIRCLQRFVRYFNAPLLLVGKSSRLDPVSPRGVNPFFFMKVCQESNANLKRPIMFAKGGYYDMLSHYLLGKMVKVPDYVIWDYDHMRKVLKEDLHVNMFKEHEDCWAFPMKQYLMVQRYGFGQKFLKATSLVRNGLMTREAAIAVHHRELAHRDDLPEVAERFLKTLNLTMEDLDQAPKIAYDKYFSGFGNWLLLQRHKLIRGKS